MRQCATVIANQYGNSQAPQVVGSQSCLNPAPFRNNLAFQSQGHCSLPRLGRYWNAHVHALGQGELFWISPLKHSDPCPTSMDQWKLRSKKRKENMFDLPCEWTADNRMKMQVWPFLFRRSAWKFKTLSSKAWRGKGKNCSRSHRQRKRCHDLNPRIWGNAG